MKTEAKRTLPAKDVKPMESASEVKGKRTKYEISDQIVPGRLLSPEEKK